MISSLYVRYTIYKRMSLVWEVPFQPRHFRFHELLIHFYCFYKFVKYFMFPSLVYSWNFNNICVFKLKKIRILVTLDYYHYFYYTNGCPLYEKYIFAHYRHLLSWTSNKIPPLEEKSLLFSLRNMTWKNRHKDAKLMIDLFVHSKMMAD